VNNVGDSRAILCSEEAGALTVKALSLDQTPFRRDERERVKAAGGKVSHLTKSSSNTVLQTQVQRTVQPRF
jgi:serine/threonine protein phosphatase PrpC